MRSARAVRGAGETSDLVLGALPDRGLAGTPRQSDRWRAAEVVQITRVREADAKPAPARRQGDRRQVSEWVGQLDDLHRALLIGSVYQRELEHRPVAERLARLGVGVRLVAGKERGLHSEGDLMLAR